MESPTQEFNRIKGADRIFNKPMKVFTKNGNKIKRATVEKDALNIFDMVDPNIKKNGGKVNTARRSSSHAALKSSHSQHSLRTSISKDRVTNIVEPMGITQVQRFGILHTPSP